MLSPSQLGFYVTASRREKRDLPKTVRLLLARTWCIDKHTVKFVIKSNETHKTEQRSCKNCGHYTALALSYIIDLDLEETRLLPSCGIFQPFTSIHQDHQSNRTVLHFWSVIFRIVTANTGTHIITSLRSKLFKNKLLWAVVTSSLVQHSAKWWKLVKLFPCSNPAIVTPFHFGIFLSPPFLSQDSGHFTGLNIYWTGSLLDSELDLSNEEEVKNSWNSGARNTHCF